MDQAARVFVDKVLKKSPKDLDYQAEVYSPKGNIVITDARMELLFERFFTIQQLAKALAEDLQQKYSDLKVAGESMRIRLTRPGP